MIMYGAMTILNWKTQRMTSQYVTIMLHKMEEFMVIRKTGQFGLRILMDLHSARILENTMFSIHGQQHASAKFAGGSKTTVTLPIPINTYK